MCSVGLPCIVTASQEFVVNDYFYIFPIEQKLDVQAHPNTEVVT